MSVTLAFLAGILAIAVWWLSQARLMSKPWLEEGLAVELPDAGGRPVSTAKIGLGVFLAVVGALFALLVSAYLMRRDMVDWRALPTPSLLWVNTGALVLSSVALQWAWNAARHDDIDGVKAGLLGGGVSALVFLAGQLLAWRQLSDEGYFLTSNPANAFFYLITALHALHLLGGLVALARTGARAWDDVEARDVRLSVELCTIYWHALLVIWLLLFALLMHWVDDFVAICRQLLT
ncbi:cytochrome c oxidase subunit 3 [Bosea sp. (in: a-proteobacteria)]|jgi:cytochrome c oxidase subunit 3|uniref:cytochrome c oxidase subunit 3 n=1 Tax=Bosea sp. (in: a-proteobacteria) TaxID=1871050 RepID=UPI003F70F688